MPQAKVEAANQKLKGIYGLQQELERTALPWERREWFETPRTPTPPSVAELQHQRDMCFSTAKLPWLTRMSKKPTDTDLQIVIRAMVDGIEDQMRSKPDHTFRMITNPHRDGHNFQDLSPKMMTHDEKVRRRVLRALHKHPLADVGELVGCPPDKWHEISQLLGGLSHGVVVQKAMRRVHSTEMKQIERARFQAAGCLHKQRSVDRGRCCVF